MNIKDEPKNLKLSVHNKYKRRLKALSLSVCDFLLHAEMKLNEPTIGKIYNKSEIKRIVEKARELAELLPSPVDAIDCPPVREDFLNVLQQATGDTEKTIADAETFLKGLSKEEWDEMVKAYNDKT